MQSVMEHKFSEVPSAEIPRSMFNRSHGHKTTFDADWLVPILVDDVIPGDTYNVSVQHFARIGSPFIHPLMDNLYLETFYFFVPYRLLWDNWEKFMGARTDPSDSIDYTIPKVSSNTGKNLATSGTHEELCNYLGLPYNTNVDMTEFSALPFRAYNLIYNEWFRDQNLQDSLPVSTGDGPDAGSSAYNLKKRGKRHDYFTSSLPWPQKGDAVDLPLAGQAPIQYVEGGADLTIQNPSGTWVDMTSSGTKLIAGVADPSGDQLYADMTAVSGATINDLRLAFQTQRLLERDARSGTRYNEMILAHYGVTVPDFRVQRPEFLGGGSSIINTHEVPNTSDTATADQAELSAYGTSAGNHGFTQSFVEHGVIIGLANVRGDITYSQGAERYWFKDTRYDFYFPVLSMIGEQSVLNREIYYQNAAADEQVFGYQERYAEYRYKPSRVSGLFAVDHSAGLDSWHLSEDFSVLPTLGDTFIQSSTGGPLDRAITVTSEPHIICDFFFDMKCARPMPTWGVPGNLDRF